MSTDIHMFAERKVGDVWVHAQDADLEQEPTSRGGFKPLPTIPEEKQLYPAQGYETFAILAGAVDYWDIVPIADMRGLPLDVSEFVKEQAGDLDDFSWGRSYLTLRELKEFDWKGHVFTQRTYVPSTEAEQHRKNGTVPGPCLSRILHNMEIPVGYEIMQWPVTYYDEAEYFLTRTIPMLESFGSPDDVRIVFWFS